MTLRDKTQCDCDHTLKAFGKPCQQHANEHKTPTPEEIARDTARVVIGMQSLSPMTKIIESALRDYGDLKVDVGLKRKTHLKCFRNLKK